MRKFLIKVIRRFYYIYKLQHLSRSRERILQNRVRSKINRSLQQHRSVTVYIYIYSETASLYIYITHIYITHTHKRNKKRRIKKARDWARVIGGLTSGGGGDDNRRHSITRCHSLSLVLRLLRYVHIYNTRDSPALCTLDLLA